MPREQMFADKHDSWGASLQAYAKERVTPAWGDTPAPPKDKRMSYYDKSRLERDYNPILMEHRNPAVERARKDREHEGSLLRLNAAREGLLRPCGCGAEVPEPPAFHARRARAS